MAIVTSGSLSGTQLQIGIALVLKDRFSNEARTASKEIRNLHREAKMAVMANLQTAETLLTTGRDVFEGMAKGLWNVIEEGNIFIDTMTTVGAITQATEEQIAKLSDTAQSLGMETMFGSVDIASGMKYLAMAGNTADEINNMIRGASFVAGATGIELAGKGGAADLITNIMRMFRIEASEASAVVGDQLTKATLSANMSMTDLAEAIKYAGADMVTLGQHLPQVAALIGVLGDAGIQGSMAGTAIGNMARYLNKSISEENYKGFRTLATLGLSKSDFLNAKGELIDFSLIIGKIRDAMVMRGMSPVDMNSTLLSIFGVRGNRAAVALMNNLDRYNDLLDKIHDSHGFAEEVMGKRMASLAGATDALLNSFENLRTTFAQQLTPVLVPLFNIIGDLVTGIRDIVATPFGKFIAGATVAVTTLGLFGTALGVIRAKMLQLKTDSLVTGSNMFALMIHGWKQSTISAQQYVNMAKVAQTQAKMGNAEALKERIKQGATIGGIAWNGTNFRSIGWDSNRYLGEDKVDDILKQYGQNKYLWARDVEQIALSGGYNRSARNRSLLMKYGSASAARSALKGTGILRSVSKFALGGLRGSLSMFGGPIGIGIMGISMLLPSLIDWIKKSKESTDKNTYSVVTLAGQYKTEQERIANRKSLRISEELATATNALKSLANSLSNGITVNLIDSETGKVISTKKLKDALSQLEKVNNQNNGVR
jgi:TP901 family phage tail tape measure protein